MKKNKRLLSYNNDKKDRNTTSKYMKKKRKEKKTSKDGGIVRHSGWHSTWKAREAEIAAGNVKQRNNDTNESKQKSEHDVIRERSKKDLDANVAQDLIGYLDWLSKRTNNLENRITKHYETNENYTNVDADTYSIQSNDTNMINNNVNKISRPRTSPVHSLQYRNLSMNTNTILKYQNEQQSQSQVYDNNNNVYNNNNRNKNFNRRRTRPKTSLQHAGKLRLDEHGLPFVSKRELRDESIPFDDQVNNFLNKYIKHQMKPKTSAKIQKWYRGIRVRHKFLRWKRRKLLKMEDIFVVWKLSWKFRKLSHNSKQRRYWAAWKEDHDDLKATKRLLERAMKKESGKTRTILANLMVGQAMSKGGNGSDAGYSPEQLKLMNDIRFEALRQAKSKAFLAWTRAVEYSKVNAEKARLHLQRVMRSLESQRQTYMWPIERCALMLKLWRRVIRFQKYIKNGGDGIPEFKDLNQLDEWDAWLAEYERWQIIYFKADTLAPLVLMRRNLIRIKRYVDNIKDARQKDKDARRHYKSYLVKRCLLSWRVEARQRGRNMRKLRKIMFTWLAWAKREKELKKRENLIASRLHDRAIGNVFMQWRWRRNAHAMVVATGLHFLLQSSAKYSLLYAIFKWKQDGPHCVMMRCWRQWTKFASRRVLWNRYLFQYRRRVARNAQSKYLRAWRMYAMKRIESRRRRKRQRYLEQTGDNVLENGSEDDYNSSDEESDVDMRFEDRNSDINWTVEWKKRSKKADSKLRGLQEGALPEDRLDEMVMRRMLIDTNELASFSDDVDSNKYSNPPIDRAGNTLLHIACGRGDANTVQNLITQGHPINITNYKDQTPLHCAARHLPLMFLPVVIHLLESGASIDMEDSTGKTPIELAINPQISFLLRRHKQRLENYEFTSKERQWYRRMRINQWSCVNHTEIWQEAVHLYVLQKKQGQGLGNENGSAVGAGGRPQSKRSRAGGISDARMERIRRLQKGAHGSVDDKSNPMAGETKFGNDGSGTVEEPSGWYSPRCLKNQWTQRYHRALAFLRTRRALENSGYRALVTTQTLKRNRRIRRMRRRLQRDKLLLSNAYLRKTVQEYEKAAKQQKYIADAGKHSSDEDEDDEFNSDDDENERKGSRKSDGDSDDNGSDSDSEHSIIESSVAESDFDLASSLNDGDNMPLNKVSSGGLEGVSISDNKNKISGIVPMPSLTDIDSRPNTAVVDGEDNTSTNVPVVSMSVKKKKKQAQASKYGMVLEDANKVVGDPLRWDTDEDSDMEDFTDTIDESLSSLLDIGKVQRRSKELKWNNKDEDDVDVDDVDEDENDDLGVINVNIAFAKAIKSLAADEDDKEKESIRFSSEHDVNLIRFGIERKLASLGGMEITVTTGLHGIPRSTEELERLESISSARPNSSSGRPSSRGKDDDESNSSKSLDGMDPEYFGQLKKAHGIALSMLDAERNDLEHRWDTCDHEIQTADAEIIKDQEKLNGLYIKRESALAELSIVIQHAKKESKNIQVQIKKTKHLAFEADQHVEKLEAKMQKIEDALEAAKQNFTIACKRRLGPDKIKKAQKAKDSAGKKLKDAGKEFQSAKEEAAALESKVHTQIQLSKKMQQLNQQNTQVHLNLLADIDKQASDLANKIETNKEATKENVRELQSLEMQLHEVKIEQGRNQAAFSDADKSENELLQGTSGSRYRRYGTTTPPSTPPLSRGSITALTMVLEEPPPQSPLQNEQQVVDKYQNDDNLGIFSEEDSSSESVSDIDFDEGKQENKGSPAQSFLLAPPKRKRPPKSAKDWKKENREVLATTPSAKAQREENLEIKAKHAVLKAEHKYLNTPPQQRRKESQSIYKDSVEVLFNEERVQHKAQLEQLAIQRAKKEKEDAKAERKKKRKTEMASSLNASESVFDVFAVEKRKKAKEGRKAAAKKKAEEKAELNGEPRVDNGESDSDTDSDDEWRKGWKDDIIYAQLLAEKKEAKYNGTSDLNNDVLTTNETNNEVGGKQQKVAKGKTGMKKQLETNKANNEMFYFGNFGVLINNKDETDEIGEHDLNENSSLIDEEESVQTTKMQSNSSKVSTDNMTDGIFEQNDDVEDGDDEVEDAMSKETDDDFSDEEPVDWRASEYPAEMFQDPLEEVDGKPKQIDPNKFMLGSSISVREATKHGIDPLIFVARDSGKRDGLAGGDFVNEETFMESTTDNYDDNDGIVLQESSVMADNTNMDDSKTTKDSALSGKNKLKKQAVFKKSESTQDKLNVNVTSVDTNNIEKKNLLETKSNEEMLTEQSSTRPRTAPMAVPRSPDARSSEAANLMFGSNSEVLDKRPNTAIVTETGSEIKLPTTEDVENMEIEAWDESVESQGLVMQGSLLNDSSTDSNRKKSDQKTELVKKKAVIKKEVRLKINWHDTINIRALKKKNDFEKRVKDDLERVLKSRIEDEKKRRMSEDGTWARMPVPDNNLLETYKPVQASTMRTAVSHPDLDILVKEDKNAIMLGKYVLEGSNFTHKPITNSFIVKSMSTPGLIQRESLRKSLEESSVYFDDEIKDQNGMIPQDQSQQFLPDSVNSAQTASDFLESISYAGDEHDAWNTFFESQYSDVSNNDNTKSYNEDLNNIKSKNLEIIGVGKGLSSLKGSFGDEKRVNSATGLKLKHKSLVTNNESTEYLVHNDRNYSPKETGIHTTLKQERKHIRASTAPTSPMRQAKGLDGTTINNDSGKSVHRETKKYDRPSSSSFRLEGSTASEISEYLSAFKANINDKTLSKNHEDVVSAYAEAIGRGETKHGNFEEKRKLLSRRSRSRGKALNTSNSLAGLKPLLVTQVSSRVSQVSSTESVPLKPLPMNIMKAMPHGLSNSSKAHQLDSGLSSYSSTLVKPNLSHAIGGSHRSSHINVSTNITSSIVGEYEKKETQKSKKEVTAKDERVENFQMIEKKKKYAKYAKNKGRLYLKGKSVLQKDVEEHDEETSINNQYEERKAREEIWERYTTRTMSTAMKAAYAELYPDIYGKDAPDTKELIHAIDPFAKFDHDNDDNSEYHLNGTDSDQFSDFEEQHEYFDDSDNFPPPRRRYDEDDHFFRDGKIDERETMAELENIQLEKELRRLEQNEIDDTHNLTKSTTKSATDLMLKESKGRDTNNLPIGQKKMNNSKRAGSAPSLVSKNESNVETMTKRDLLENNGVEKEHTITTQAQRRAMKKITAKSDQPALDVPINTILAYNKNNDDKNHNIKELDRSKKEERDNAVAAVDGDMNNEDVSLNNINPSEPRNSLEKERNIIKGDLKRNVDFNQKLENANEKYAKKGTEKNVINAAILDTQPVEVFHSPSPTVEKDSMLIETDLVEDGDKNVVDKQKGELSKHDVETRNTITDTKKGPLLSTTAKEEIKTQRTEDKKDIVPEDKQSKIEKIVDGKNKIDDLETTNHSEQHNFNVDINKDLVVVENKVDEKNSEIVATENDKSKNTNKLEDEIENMDKENVQKSIDIGTVDKTNVNKPVFLSKKSSTKNIDEKKKMPWDKKDFGINSDSHINMLKTKKITEDLQRLKELEIQRLKEIEMQKEEDRILAEQEARRLEAETDETRLLNLFSRDSEQVNLQYDSRRRTNLMKDIQLGRKLEEIFKIKDENIKKQEQMLIKTSNSEGLAQRLKSGMQNLKS